MYDIFFISEDAKYADNKFAKLKIRFPLAKRASSINVAQQKSSTKMLWIIYPDTTILDTFDFNYKVQIWDEPYVHIFKNDNLYNGIFLISKLVKLSQNEINYRFYINNKEINMQASTATLYDRFVIDDYDSYLAALANTTTELFWMESKDIAAVDDFKFDLHFKFDNHYDRKQNHAFLHLEDGNQTYDGIFLCSTHTILSQKEIEHRFPVDRKEWPIVASTPKLYDRFVVDNYDEYLSALAHTTTELFWMESKDIAAVDDFKFDLHFKFDNHYDRTQNHAFLHLEDGNQTYDGIFLCSTHTILSQKEIEHRFPVDRKEWNIIASTYKSYDRFVIDSYDEYLSALERTTTELFWMESKDIVAVDDFNFDLHFKFSNEYDRKQNHAFLHLEDGNQTYDGIFLCSTHTILSQKEIEHRFPVDRKEWPIVASTYKSYDRFVIDSYDEYLSALERTTTELFWMESKDIVAVDDFNFDMYFSKKNAVYNYDRKQNHAFIHIEDSTQKYDGIFLCSTHTILSQKEIEHRFPVDRKEWPIVASTPKLYDRFVIDSYDGYLSALAHTTTELFWMESKDIVAVDDFKFDLFFSKKNAVYNYDRKQNHAFIHIEDSNQTYDGIFLCSTHAVLSQKEIEHRFPVDRKEWPIVASTYKSYDRFVIDHYDSYIAALANTTTELFWMESTDIVAVDDFNFDMYFSKKNAAYDYDRTQNHAFLHLEDGNQTYDGIFLCSTHTILSQKEIEHRFPVDRKEWDIIASTPKLYDRFVVDSYDEYLSALAHTTTELFWMESKDIAAVDDFKFDLFFSKKNAEYDFDRYQNHAFIHIEDGNQTYDGIFLCSTHAVLSQKEIEHRFPVDRKEWPIVASTPKLYDRFVVDSYDEYLSALERTTTELFWMESCNIKPVDDFKFDLFFSKKNAEYDFDRYQNHAFVHNSDTYNGIFLCSSHAELSQKEIEHRFPVDRKEWPIVASKTGWYDIVFISYNESNADENFDKLVNRFPYAQRVHGVKGIHQAHIAAAKLASSPMFWVVDGDAVIEETFNFDMIISKNEMNIVYTWNSKNPINSLNYGYGGVKLLPRDLTLNVNIHAPDMTTAISSEFKVMPEISNVTAFNTSPFDTWKSAFRECVKLSSRLIDGQVDYESKGRLETWCTVGEEQQFGNFAIAGANAGKVYGQENAGNIPALAMINDFDWLQTQFKSSK